MGASVAYNCMARHAATPLRRYASVGRATDNKRPTPSNKIKAGSERFPQVISSPGIQLSLSTNNFVVHHGQLHLVQSAERQRAMRRANDATHDADR